jgi:DNA-binding XRE family transcriptional regulator
VYLFYSFKKDLSTIAFNISPYTGEKGVSTMIEFNRLAVGTVIKNIRIKKKLSQEVVSGFAGIARSHLAMIENGSKQANFETIWKIANALEIPPHEIVFLIEKEAESIATKKTEQ